MRLTTLCCLAVSLSLAAPWPALAESWIYWVREGELGRVSLDGRVLEPLISGSVSPTSVAVDSDQGFVYWTDLRTDRLTKTSLRGGESQDLLRDVRGLGSVRLQGDWLYFNTHSAIHRMTREGQGLERILEVERVVDLLLVGDRILWAERDDPVLHSAALDGSNRGEVFQLGVASAAHLALEQERLWWVDETGRTLWSAPLRRDPDGKVVGRSASRVEYRTAGRQRLTALAADDSGVFLTVDDGPRLDPAIHRLAADGSLSRLPLETSYPTSVLEVNDGSIYWGELRDGALVSSALAGGKPTPVTVQRIHQPAAIVEARGWIYWLEQKRLGRSATRVRRCRLDGSQVEEVVELPSSSLPVDMVVHDNHLVVLLSRPGSDEIWAQQLGAGERFRVDLESVDASVREEMVDLVVTPSGQLHWVTASGEVWRFELVAATPKRVRRLPVETKEASRFASTDEPIRPRSLVVGPPDYFIDLTRDAVFRLDGKKERLLSEDLYVKSLEPYGDRLYWSGTQAIGTITPNGVVDVVFPIWHTQDIVVVDKEPHQEPNR